MTSIPHYPHESERMERIGDDWLIGGRDYLEPIYRLDLERAAKYANNHRCPECRAQLIAVDDGDKYQVVCPNGHEVSETTVITNQQAQLAEDAEVFGQMEINVASNPRRTEAEILKDLGF